MVVLGQVARTGTTTGDGVCGQPISLTTQTTDKPATARDPVTRADRARRLWGNGRLAAAPVCPNPALRATPVTQGRGGVCRLLQRLEAQPVRPRALFAQPPDILQLIKLRELYGWLEETVDACKDAATIISAIVIKGS